MSGSGTDAGTSLEGESVSSREGVVGEVSADAASDVPERPRSGSGRWWLAGAGIAALFLMLVAAAVWTVPGRSVGGVELLDYVSSDADVVAVWRVSAIMDAVDALDDFRGYEVRGWDLRYSVQDGSILVGSLWIEGRGVEEYLMAVDLDDLVGYSLLKGVFWFDDLRYELEEVGYERGVYRTFEVWAGSSHYGFLEDEGVIVAAADRDSLRSVINHHYSDGLSVASAPEHDLRRILERVGPGVFQFASAGDDTQWGCSLRRCQGYGLALTGYDALEEEADVEFVMLFSSERSAAAAADEYDELLSFAESVQSNGFFSFGGEVRIEDGVSDGEFVVGQASVSP